MQVVTEIPNGPSVIVTLVVAPLHVLLVVVVVPSPPLTDSTSAKFRVLIAIPFKLKPAEKTRSALAPPPPLAESTAFAPAYRIDL